MKVTNLLPLATLAAAIVVPDEQMVEQLAIQSKHSIQEVWDRVPSASDAADEVRNLFGDAVKGASQMFDAAVELATKESDNVFNTFEKAWTTQDVESWLLGGSSDPMGSLFSPPPPPKDGKHPKKGKGKGKPGKGKKPDHGPPHHGPPHHHDPHHHTNETLWQLISTSKYTTKLASYLKNDTELVKLLNGTSHNFTLFAPIDKAIPDQPHHLPPQRFINKILSYHVVPAFLPLGRVIHARTVGTYLNESALGGPQRLKFGLGLRGLTVNYFTRVVAANIFGSNGVIHAVDHVLFPPPPVAVILSLLPGDFSTLSLGLTKTGLLEELNTTTHVGSTVFAPDNFAFKKLGPKINAFLFSSYGEKYLKALLEYHISLNHTLYSNAYYDHTKSSATDFSVKECDSGKEKANNAPKFHIDLPTLLSDRYLSIDIGSWGPFTEIKINGFSRVKVQDGIAKDGVLQIVGDVLIPPKTKSTGEKRRGEWAGEELSVEELKERLEPFVKGGKEQEEQLEL